MNKVFQIFTAVAILAIALAGPPLRTLEAASAPAYVSHTPPDTSTELRQSATFPHTVPAGDNRLLMIAVMIRADEWVSSITYSDSDLTLAKVQDGGDSDDQRVELWYQVGPPVGEANVVVNFASYVNPDGIAAVNFTEVDQSSPIGATAGANATSGTEATTNITTLNDNSLIFGAVSARGANTYPFKPGTGITNVWNEYTGPHTDDDDGLWGGWREAATAGTYPFNTTLNVGDHWAIACVELRYFSPPSFVSITPDKSSYKDGDTITLTVTLDNHNTGCDLTADFSSIDDQYVTGKESVVNWGTDGVDNDGDGHVDNPAEQGVYVITYLISRVSGRGDGTYPVAVTAVDGGGNSATSSTNLTLDNTPPSAPTNLAATATAGGPIQLTWTASPEADLAYYNIYRATSSGGQNYFSPTYQVSAGTTTYTDTATTNGVTYYYVVRAQDAAGNIETNTNEASATASVTGLPPPTNLTATAIAGDGIKLTWTASSPETDVYQYNIYRAATSGGEDYSSPTYTVSAGVTTYADVDTTNGVTFYYVVRAQDAAGNIETNTFEASATAGITTGPSFSSITSDKDAYKNGDTITLTVTLDNHNTGCTLTANFSSIDDQYITGKESVVNWGTDGVDNDGDGHVDNPAEQGVYVISYLISTVNSKADGSYSISVIATNGAGNSASSSINLTLDNTAPPAPTDLSATTLAEGGIKLTWTASSPETDVAQYNIYRAITSGGQNYTSPTYIVSSGTTTYTDTSITDGVTFYYVVRAQDIAGNIETNTFEASATASVTGPPPPTNLTATAIAGGGIKLTWTASSPETDVARYNIYRATTSGGEDYSFPTYTVSVGTTTYTDTSTTDGVTYYYVVRAQDNVGNIETNTNEVSATASIVGPPVNVSQIYIEYGGELLYDLASSTDSDNPAVFAKGKIDEIYLRLNLSSEFELNETSSSITLFKGVGKNAEQVSGSQEINQGTGWAELIFHLDPVFDPDVDKHSRDALHWVDASVVSTAGSTNDFDFYFVYDTTSPAAPHFQISSFDSTTGSITVSGTTVPDNLSDPQQVEIFVNDPSNPKAIVTADVNYQFEKRGIGLIKGTNYIAVQSMDRAKNKSERSKSLKLNYNPEALLSIVIRSPHVVRSGSSTEPVKIIYSVTQPAEITIRIFNLKGELVKDWRGYASPGGEIEWNWYGRNMYEEEVNNGVYIFRIKAKAGSGENDSLTKLVAVLR